MVLEVHRKPRQTESRPSARFSVLGDGLLERARSTLFALLGLTAAVGLGVVALALNQSWPVVPDSPIPSLGERHQAVDEATVAATEDDRNGSAAARDGAGQSRSPGSGGSPEQGGGDAPVSAPQDSAARFVGVSGSTAASTPTVTSPDPSSPGKPPATTTEPAPAPAPSPPVSSPSPPQPTLASVPPSSAPPSSAGAPPPESSEEPDEDEDDDDCPPEAEWDDDDHGHAYGRDRGRGR